MEELKRCQFCGGVAHIIYDHDVVEESSKKDWAYTVECGACAASSGLCYSKEQAIEVWNRRGVRDAIMQEPTAEPEQRYTEEELRVFAHGISLSLLSKRSAQHWRYDKDTATEIEFLERLYDKVSADMKGGQG